MMTKIIRASAWAKGSEKIKSAAKIVASGGLVAFPTETVYGIGANALNAKAVRKIFRAKGRPFDDPLIVHVASIGQAKMLTMDIPTNAKKLMRKFWPGPLTIVLKKSSEVPGITTAGLKTVAIRIPKNKIALALIEAAECPIAAPSANMFGKPSPTNARQVMHDLGGKIDCIIDGGRTRIGVESTVIDLFGKTPVLLRPGGVTLEQLEATIGKVKVHPLAKTPATKMAKKITQKNAGNSKKLLAIAPGMKYRHYAPEAKVILVEGPARKAKARIKQILLANQENKVGVIYAKGSPAAAAKSLYSKLRGFDSRGTKLVVVQSLSEKGIGFAVMNRLRKAATSIVKA